MSVMIMSWCAQAECDPCKKPGTFGNLYVVGAASFGLPYCTFGADYGKGTVLCASVFAVVGIPPDWVGKVVTGSVSLTWHAQLMGAPISGSITLTSSGHYGGALGECPPLQWTLLPKTILSTVDFGTSCYFDPPDPTPMYSNGFTLAPNPDYIQIGIDGP